MDAWLAPIPAVLGGLLLGVVLAARLRAGPSDPEPRVGPAYALALERLRELDAERGRMPEEAWRRERRERLEEAANLLRLYEAQATSSARTRTWPLLVAGVLVVVVLVAAAASLSGPAPVTPPPSMARSPHEAVSVADQALPADVGTLSEHAYRSILDGDLPTAMALVERARQLDREDPDVKVNVCALRVAVGMLDRADAGLDEILDAHPDHLRARLWKGLVRARLGDREAAERAWRDVAERDPEGMEGAHARTLLAHPASKPSAP